MGGRAERITEIQQSIWRGGIKARRTRRLIGKEERHGLDIA